MPIKSADKQLNFFVPNLTKSYEECRMLSKYKSLPTEEKADYEANSEEYNKRRMNNLSVCFKEV